MEHETLKLKEQEEMYTREIKDWRAQLKPRKQVMFTSNYSLSHVVVDNLLEHPVLVTTSISVV